MSATSNNSIEPEMHTILVSFDNFITSLEVDKKINEISKKLLPQISPEKPYAVADLCAADLQMAFPKGVGSIRIAVFYPGCETGVERHPNSTQFLYSVRGTGETRVLRNEKWEIDSYGKISNDNLLEERWHVVEKGIWHHSVATGKEPWILAALHSAKNVQDEYQE